MMSMSVVRTHFCTVVARVNPRFLTPRKTGLNCTMPAVVSSSDGSSGISDDDGCRRQPLLSKKERKLSRISAEFTSSLLMRSRVIRPMPSGDAGSALVGRRRPDRIAGASEQRPVLAGELAAGCAARSSRRRGPCRSPRPGWRTACPGIPNRVPPTSSENITRIGCRSTWSDMTRGVTTVSVKFCATTTTTTASTAVQRAHEQADEPGDQPGDERPDVGHVVEDERDDAEHQRVGHADDRQPDRRERAGRRATRSSGPSGSRRPPGSPSRCRCSASSSNFGPAMQQDLLANLGQVLERPERDDQREEEVEERRSPRRRRR